MNYYKARELVKEILANHQSIDLEECTPSDTLKSKGIDSLDLVCLAMDVEDKLGIEIPEIPFTSLITFKDLIDFVEKLTDEEKCQMN